MHMGYIASVFLQSPITTEIMLPARKLLKVIISKTMKAKATIVNCIDSVCIYK